MTVATLAPPAPPAVLRSPDRARGDATAHMCAAAYLDYEFRENVVKEVYARPDVAVAPNAACDAVPVLRHVRRARAIDLAQHLVLAAMLAVFALAPFVNRPILFACLAAWLVIGFKLRGEGRTSYSGFEGEPVEPAKPSGESLRVSSHRRRTLVERLLRSVAERCKRTHLVVVAVVLAVLVWADSFTAPVPVWAALAAVVGCRGAFEWIRLYCLSRVPKADASRAGRNRRTAAIGSAQRSPVVVFPRGGERRFPGYGVRSQAVLIPLPLKQTEEQRDQGPMVPFTVTELHGFLRERIEEASADSSSASRLPGLVVEEQCFVSDFYLTRPVTAVEELPWEIRPGETLPRVARRADPPVRRELRFQVSTRDGESVTTVFTRFTLEGRTLSMCFSPCALPPTRAEYHVFRDGPLRWWSALAWCTLAAAATAPVDVFLSPVDLAVRVAHGVRNAVSGHPKLRGWRPPDCGARRSIRELSCDPDVRSLDFTEAETYVRILYQHVVAALQQFLEEHRIDAGPLAEQIKTIVNFSVVNNGELYAGTIGPWGRSTNGSIGQGATGTVVVHRPDTSEGAGE